MNAFAELWVELRDLGKPSLVVVAVLLVLLLGWLVA